MNDLVYGKTNKRKTLIFFLNAVFEHILEMMNDSQSHDKNPEKGISKIGCDKQERHQGVHECVQHVADFAFEFELVELLKLEDKVRDQVRQDEF